MRYQTLWQINKLLLPNPTVHGDTKQIMSYDTKPFCNQYIKNDPNLQVHRVGFNLSQQKSTKTMFKL